MKTGTLYIDNIEDEFVSKVNGEVIILTKVNKRPVADVAPEINETEVAYSTALSVLINAIDQAKEKAELFSLGIELQENLDKKIAEYQDAKTAYDEAKGAL